ncbi:hypothetical protein P154DRAFT_436471, partial [Amniculicola lignicola CBS 123094]
YDQRASQLQTLIKCTDLDGRFNISTVEKWETYKNKLREIYEYASDEYVWSRIALCQNVPFSPPDSQKWHGKQIRPNSILFTTNIIDPVASSADKMAQFYPGSVVLKQNTVGVSIMQNHNFSYHSLLIANSKCISRYLTKFMETGMLPPHHTLCEAEEKNPFFPRST